MKEVIIGCIITATVICCSIWFGVLTAIIIGAVVAVVLVIYYIINKKQSKTKEKVSDTPVRTKSTLTRVESNSSTNIEALTSEHTNTNETNNIEEVMKQLRKQRMSQASNKDCRKQIDILMDNTIGINKSIDKVKGIIREKFQDTELSYMKYMQTIESIENKVIEIINKSISKINDYGYYWERINKFDKNTSSPDKDKLLETMQENTDEINTMIEEIKSTCIKIDELAIEIIKTTNNGDTEIDTTELDELIENTKLYK